MGAQPAVPPMPGDLAPLVRELNRVEPSGTIFWPVWVPEHGDQPGAWMVAMVPRGALALATYFQAAEKREEALADHFRPAERGERGEES